jgi:hypothetical protein
MRSSLLLLAVIVPAAAIAIGCATTPAELAWSRRLDEQPTIVRLPVDSADAALSRAEQWLRAHSGAREIVVGIDRIDTRPEPQGAQRWFSVVRTSDADSVTIAVHQTNGVRTPVDLIGVVGPTAQERELALFVATGETSTGFATSYLPDSSLVNEAAEITEMRPHRAWLSFGDGPYAFAFEAGLRKDWWGISYGATDFGGPYDPIPDFDSTDRRPAGAYASESFAGLFNGVNVYGFVDLEPWVSLYGTAGLYVRVYTELDHNELTGGYYEGEGSTRWDDPTPALGAGVQLTLARHLVLGAGYSTVGGALAQIGWRW